MKKFLEKTKNYEFPDDIAFIPSVGESKVSLLASIFTGYNLDYKIILDEKGTKQTRKKFENECLGEKIILIGDNGQSIEDLFSKEDFEKFCISKNNKLSKTYTSKQFFENIENEKITSLSGHTVIRFVALLDKLKQV